MCDAAAKIGNKDVFNLFQSSWNLETCFFVAEKGHFEALKWLHAEGCKGSAESICYGAAKAGHLEMIQWTVSQKWNNSRSAEIAARRAANHICAAAAQAGHLNVVKWAMHLKRNCWDINTRAKAVESGHVHIMEWALSAGVPGHSSACAAAAFVGRLDVLQWCRANDFPRDNRMFWNGPGHSIARGTVMRISMLLWETKWNHCNGSIGMVALLRRTSCSTVLIGSVTRT